MILAPATAHAVDNNGPSDSGDCHYTDKDGYDIPIDEGQTVIVDGKNVTCSGGTITTSPATKTSRSTPSSRRRIPLSHRGARPC
jgi:hypothetical protein